MSRRLMEEVRTFIAVELPEEVKDHIASLQRRLRSTHERAVKWVEPEGIHLTLKFLGNVSVEKIPLLREAVEQAAMGIRAFYLKVGELGVFPSARYPRVIWVGVGGDTQRFGTLQQRIDESTVPLGFPSEKRAFVPHLTLGRVREGTGREEREKLGRLVESVKAEGPVDFRVEGVSIMRSQLRPSGAIYSRMEFVQL